jgi:hypothetical protein
MPSNGTGTGKGTGKNEAGERLASGMRVESNETETEMIGK